MAAAKAKKDGKGSLVVTIGVLTVLAAVGGGLTGKLLVGRARAAATPIGSAASAEAKPLLTAQNTEVRELPAIVTNLANPAGTRVRLQVAMVYPKGAVENPTLLSAKVGEDIVAFLNTLGVAGLQGPSGLQALREDLNERAAIRSEGKVHEIIIEALVVQ